MFRDTTPSDAEPYSLYSRLEEVLGTPEADYLMTHLPRDSSDQVATKADIVRLEARFDRFDARFDRLEERFEGRIDSLMSTIIYQQKYYARTTVWSMVGLTAIFSLVVTFFG